MAAIAADTGASDKGWGRVVSFNLSAGSGYVEKARKAATNTVQFSSQLLWSTGKAAWMAGTSLLVLVVPLVVQMDRDQQTVDLEGQLGEKATTPGTPTVK